MVGHHHARKALFDQGVNVLSYIRAAAAAGAGVHVHIVLKHTVILRNEDFSLLYHIENAPSRLFFPAPRAFLFKGFIFSISEKRYFFFRKDML
jgi:hypothetical protein